jgi:iron(III) transport system substrate-binding protein
MKAIFPFAAALAILLLGPLLLHHRAASSGTYAEETLVIITPHNEATRYEFARAFSDYYFQKTGRTVFVDWRTAGGTSEIGRYIAAQYLGSFRDYWTRILHRDWTPACAAFDDPRTTAPDAIAAHKAFLSSDAGCGVDLFFGGGTFDYIQMANAGRLVDSGIIKAHPELFGQNATTPIPQTLGGEPLWDPKGCWIGACLSAFGICYNTDSLARLGISNPPAQWADLTSPAYLDQLALADPTQSGSVAKAFEMILQQQIDQSGGTVSHGWLLGLHLIQRMAANSRYFTDGMAGIPASVESGEAAAGTCIDFYGRFESEAVRRPDGASRLVYITPQAGSSIGADSIGLFRGAPHAALAREFIDFVISPAGQKLWTFRAGTPGGPEKYTLRRLSIRPDFYTPQYRPYEADPGVNPYAPGAGLIYHPEWTGPLLSVISFEIKTAFIDPHDELHDAWQALIQSKFSPQATAAFADLSAIDSAQSGAILKALRSPDKLDSITLERTLATRFRAQYLRAATLARQGM